MVLITLMVIGAGRLTGSLLHGLFGSEKRPVDPRLVEGGSLPWSLNFEITQAAVAGNVVAQGDSDTIGCRIVVDGEVKAQRISNEVNAFTFCLLKNA